MNQTKFHSAVEIGTSTTIGYIVAVCSQMIIFPMFGLEVAFHDNFIIAAWFTVVSLIRGYMVRRYFNNLGSEIDDFLARLIVKFKKMKSSSFQRSDFHSRKNVDFHSRKNVDFHRKQNVKSHDNANVELYGDMHPILQEVKSNGG